PGQNEAAVQINLRRAVESIEDEIEVGARKECGRNVKGKAVLPALVLNILQLRFVVAVIRVGNLLVGEQVEMDVTGNCRWHPACLRISRRRHLAEQPASVEDDCRIPRYACLSAYLRASLGRRRC